MMPPGVFALAVAAFSVSTAEFIVSGLLPQLSDELHVTIPTAGLLVTGYAAGVAIISPILAALTARLPRRTMLIAILGVFVIGQVLCAIAPNYATLLAARLLVACAHGMFFGVSLIMVGILAGTTQGRALSIFFAGLTLATILGIPGGTAIGTAFGWRAAFGFVGLLSGVATLAVVLLVPRQGSDGPGLTAIGPQLRELAKQQVFLSYLIIAINALGCFAFLTYEVALLREVTGVDAATIPVYLFVAGVGTVIGSVIGGRLTDWHLMPSVIVVMALQAIAFVATAFAIHTPLLIAALLCVGGFLLGAFATPIQGRIVVAARDAPTLAGSLISTAFNVGIGGGALAGALLLSTGAGYVALPALAAACSAIAAGVGLLSWRLETPRRLTAQRSRA